MVRIAHEFPLQVYQHDKGSFVRQSTDYDYALVHRLNVPEYFNYMKESVDLQRPVILDNSIFELGKAFNDEKYLVEIQRLQPTEVIFPDVFNDREKNLEAFFSFHKKFWNVFKYQRIRPQVIAVLQGKILEDLLLSYKTLQGNCDKIAIPFGSKAFDFIPAKVKDAELKSDPLFRKSYNRAQFVTALSKLKYSKPLHLLGCHYLCEYDYYRGVTTNVQTIDTSHPVALAAEQISYWDIPNTAALYKPAVKIDEIFLNSNVDIIKVGENIKFFKDYLKGPFK